jgi:hypothetical protein
MRYILYTTLIICGFSLLEWRGLNLLPTGDSARVPPSLRNAVGYRSYQSFHGGK